MKIIFDNAQKSVIRFDKGDEVIGLLGDLAKERDASFFFSMIGGCGEVAVAYFDTKTKEYVAKDFSAENFEVINITGNVAWFEGSPLVHAHGVFGHEDYSCFGGHVMRMIISLNCEVAIDWMSEKLEKIVGENGLKIFK